MRFSYIDAQGKEMEIGGTGQLAARIRLGAVTDDTPLYDAATDKWAPAGEHAVYRELSQVLGEELEGTTGGGATGGGASGGGGPAGPGDSGPVGSTGLPPGRPEAGPDKPAPPGKPAPEGEEDRHTVPFDLGVDFGATEEPPAEEASGGMGHVDLEDLDLGELSLVDDVEGEEPEPAVAEPTPEAKPRRAPFEREMGPSPSTGQATGEVGDHEEETVDAGEPSPMAGTSRDLEGQPLGEEPAVRATRQEEPEADEIEAEETGPREPGLDEAGVGDPDEAALGTEMELESPMEALGGADDETSAGLAEADDEGLRTGASQEDWTRRPRDEEPERTPEPEDRWEQDRAAPVAEAPEPRIQPQKPTKAPARRRRAPPQRRKRRGPSVLKILIPILVLAAGGAAGYTLFLQGGESPEVVEPADPGPDPRETRTVPAGLERPMAAVASDAADRMVAWLGDLRARQEMPERPPEEWLDGIYLAHASQYPGVAAYWEGLLGLVTEVRSEAPDRFLRAYDAALAEAGLESEAGEQLRAWAVEDFEWSGARRERVYQAMEEVARAALDLHELLVAREEEIDYELLEAVPRTEELQAEIDGHFDRITDGLDSMDALGEVRTERFLGILGEAFRTSVAP